jgi:DNA ligase-1
MLAVDIGDAPIRFPVVASPKLDGIRCLIKGGVALSRNLKPIPNQFIQSYFPGKFFEGLDGELTVGDPWNKNCMQATTSGVMSKAGEPDFTFWAFDRWDQPTVPYYQRSGVAYQLKDPRVKWLTNRLIGNQAQLDAYEAEQLEIGYEGLILRSINSPYKYGRSTVKEGYLLKVKRFTDSEAEVIGFEERMHNGNEATTDELGRTKRSSHAGGKTGRGDLGAFLVRDCILGCEFSVGTGLTDSDRAYYWAHRDDQIGRILKYKSFDKGVLVAPRFPVFLGFRDPIDI